MSFNPKWPGFAGKSFFLARPFFFTYNAPHNHPIEEKENNMKKTLLAVLLALLWTVSAAWAGGSPLGKWKTIDDETKKEKSIVEVYEQDGKIYGRILQLLQEKDGGKGKLCTKCTGADYNKPTVGLVFLKEMKADGDAYAGGTIMDPNNGKTYKCKMEVVENGAKMKVRGFIGVSLMGRNQFWHKVQ
jgi:uncharacterized protein (DUF2147 family)